jgi:hypothetical protein
VRSVRPFIPTMSGKRSISAITVSGPLRDWTAVVNLVMKSAFGTASTWKSTFGYAARKESTTDWKPARSSSPVKLFQ